MTEYLEEYENVLDKEFCDYIITNFLEEKKKCDGVTSGGINKEVKNTKDFHLKHNNNEIWMQIDKKLYESLNECLAQYRNKYECFRIYEKMDDTGFQIQQYIKNEGFYIYHHDFVANRKKYRLLTFLFYLNDVEEGGETEFFYGRYKVKPKAGKCVLFPASWTFPHCGIMPISNDKFIITGWLHNDIIDITF